MQQVASPVAQRLTNHSSRTRIAASFKCMGSAISSTPDPRVTGRLNSSVRPARANSWRLLLDVPVPTLRSFPFFGYIQAARRGFRVRASGLRPVRFAPRLEHAGLNFSGARALPVRARAPSLLASATSRAGGLAGCQCPSHHGRPNSSFKPNPYRCFVQMYGQRHIFSSRSTRYGSA